MMLRRKSSPSLFTRNASSEEHSAGQARRAHGPAYVDREPAPHSNLVEDHPGDLIEHFRGAAIFGVCQLDDQHEEGFLDHDTRALIRRVQLEN